MRLQTKNFEKVGLAGRESEFVSDVNYLPYKKLNYNKYFYILLRKIPFPCPHCSLIPSILVVFLKNNLTHQK